MNSETRLGLSWRLRLIIAALLLVAAGVVLVTNRLLSDRFIESTRNRAELRLALYSGNLISELQRTSVVPLLLARDPDLIEALQAGNFSVTTGNLIRLQEEIGVAAIQLLDEQGRIVAATNRNILGGNLRQSPFYVEALRSGDTVFTSAII